MDNIKELLQSLHIDGKCISKTQVGLDKVIKRIKYEQIVFFYLLCLKRFQK
jgi:hypothetical protein